jgi:hypothetical protein
LLLFLFPRSLHLAALGGHLALLKFLLRQKKRVVVNCVDRFGRSPLQEAAKKGRVECCDLLKKHGATEMDQKSGFALCTAAAAGDLGALKEMLMRGVNLATADYDGRTALHLAAAEGKPQVVQWLLKQPAARGAVNAVDRMYQTPLDAALGGGVGGKNKSGMNQAVDFLKGAGGVTWKEQCEEEATSSEGEGDYGDDSGSSSYPGPTIGSTAVEAVQN